jgi:hypothetical protein
MVMVCIGIGINARPGAESSGAKKGAAHHALLLFPSPV